MFHAYATQMLRNEHKTLSGLFFQFEAIQQRLWEQGNVTAGSERKGAVVDELFSLLEVYTQIEEEIFYPALAGVSDQNMHGKVDEAFRDHDTVMEQIQDLRNTNLNSEDFVDKLNDLKSDVLAHFKLEENELFPYAEKWLSSKLGEIGVQMEFRKGELMESRRSILLRAQDPKGGEQKRVA